MNVVEFVIESNRIEGILRPPTVEEVDATREFVFSAHVPTVESLSSLALVYARSHGVLRDKVGMNVRVSSHVPQSGGPHIRANLAGLLKTVGESDPFEFHVAYELLHPFMDGNGRTGRALWAWQMWRTSPEWLDLSFLHAWYYQSLRAAVPQRGHCRRCELHGGGFCRCGCPECFEARKRVREANDVRLPSVVSFVVPGCPVTKPRQTQSDKWKKRPSVIRYREWADQARAESRKAIGQKFPGMVLMACTRMRVIAFFPIPPSWNKVVKEKMKGQPHRQSKDADNILKACSDALFPTGDAQIYDMHVMKFWADEKGPRVEITIY
ncbi:MAG: RusA family crossover junction endodeoxyribonuclease [Acidobacteriota bacterium]